MSIETVSFFVIYVIHHKPDFIIIQIGKRTAFRTYITNILMIFLTGTFLPEAIGVTVKNRSTFSSVAEFFHFLSGREFLTAICENYRKQLFKSNFEEMAKKTAIKRVLKFAPVKADFARAIATDETIKTELVVDMTEVHGQEIVDGEGDFVDEEV